MSRPLELITYPKRYVTTGFVRWNGDGTTTDLSVPEWLIDGEWNRFPRTEDKRFTDAELAAEGYKMQNEMLSIRLHQAELTNEGDLSGAELFEIPRWRKVEQGHKLHRFATLPSYDEVA